MANPNQPNLGQTKQDIIDIASMTEETFRSVADNIQSMFRDALDKGASLSKSFKNDISNQIRSITRDSSKLADNFEKLNRGTLKQVDITKQLESRNARLLSIEVSIQALRAQGTLESISLAHKLSKEYDGMVNINKEFNKTLEEQSQRIKTSADEVNKQLGFTPKLLGGLDKSLSKLGLPNLGFNDALKKTHELGQAADAGKGGFNAWKTYTKQVGSNLSESLSKANLMQAGVGLLVEAFFKLDSMIGDTAKSMGISYQTATKLNSSFVNMANSSGNLFVTTKGINESFNQINAALGTNGKISAEILVTQTELVKQAGYSVEAATMLSKLSLATGKPTKEIAANFLGQVKALNLVNGTAINEKQLLEDISKVSKDTLATFASQPGKLAEAAYEARKLGLDLEKLKGTQSSLLDIESSIASEFEAEVLTGKQLNLERARFFALTNDYAGLARELGKQDITRASFAKMNVIQQEATAKALGMSADTMGGMLIDQEAMSKLSGIDGDNAKERFNNLVKEVGLTEAKKRLGNETLADQMASASIQDRFTASVEKLKEAFVGLMTPIMPILDAFSNLIGFIAQSEMAIKGLQIVMTALAAKSLVTAIASIFIGSAPLGLPGLIAAGVATAALTAATLSATQSVQDGIAPASKGPFTITDKFGATAGTAEGDGLYVGPNIKTQSTLQQQTPAIDYDKMAQAMSRVQVQTNLDGVNVSRKLQTPMGIATRKL